eukprot:PhM_4_TR11548/c0_g1_i1/m.10843
MAEPSRNPRPSSAPVKFVPRQPTVNMPRILQSPRPSTPRDAIASRIERERKQPDEFDTDPLTAVPRVNLARGVMSFAKQVSRDTRLAITTPRHVSSDGDYFVQDNPSRIAMDMQFQARPERHLRGFSLNKCIAHQSAPDSARSTNGISTARSVSSAGGCFSAEPLAESRPDTGEFPSRSAMSEGRIPSRARASSPTTAPPPRPRLLVRPPRTWGTMEPHIPSVSMERSVSRTQQSKASNRHAVKPATDVACYPHEDIQSHVPGFSMAKSLHTTRSRPSSAPRASAASIKAASVGSTITHNNPVVKGHVRMDKQISRGAVRGGPTDFVGHLVGIAEIPKSQQKRVVSVPDMQKMQRYSSPKVQQPTLTLNVKYNTVEPNVRGPLLNKTIPRSSRHLALLQTKIQDFHRDLKIYDTHNGDALLHPKTVRDVYLSPRDRFEKNAITKKDDNQDMIDESATHGVITSFETTTAGFLTSSRSMRTSVFMSGSMGSPKSH